MKDKAPIIVLIIVAAGLGFALLVVNNNAHREKQELYSALVNESNNVVSVKASLNEQQAVNQALETNLASTRADYSNKLAVSEANLLTTENNLVKAQADAKAKADADTAEIAGLDKKITDLENQNQDLDKQATDLRDHITTLQSQISTTQDKLARSEGDRGILLKELKRLQTEKTVWENRFRDLAVLQAQVHKLKSDLAEARSLDWIRHGVYASFKEKGAERLVSPNQNLPAELNPNLRVEVHQDGRSNMITPIPGDNSTK